jgi:hypothetical protein
MSVCGGTGVELGVCVAAGESVGSWDLMVWTLKKPTSMQARTASASLLFTFVAPCRVIMIRCLLNSHCGTEAFSNQNTLTINQNKPAVNKTYKADL